MLNRIVCFILLLMSLTPCFAAPKVAITIKPLHGLVASIMQGIAEPVLLLPDNASPHTFQLKPSTLKALQEASLIMWVGPSLELFMQRPLEQLHPKDGLITFMDVAHLTLLNQRAGRQWAHHHHEDENEHDDHDHIHEHDIRDPHFWLSTDNALVVIDYVESYLAKIDKENAARYKTNAQQLRANITALKSQLNKKLSAVHNKPFLVYHDGYQYFEKEFDLNAVGTFMLNPHLPLSAKALSEVKQLIQSQGVKCVFRETEFNDSKIELLLSDAGVKFTELDPLGARINAGPDAYQRIMLGLADTFAHCLAQ